mgnify:CR=1 FL=1
MEFFWKCRTAWLRFFSNNEGREFFRNLAFKKKLNRPISEANSQAASKHLEKSLTPLNNLENLLSFEGASKPKAREERWAQRARTMGSMR